MGRKLIPTNIKREDCIQTPLDLAIDIVNHFKPEGKILEPCKGEGNFIKAYETYNLINQVSGNNGIEWAWTEILEGKDFFEWTENIENAGFGIKEIIIFDTPKTFPSAGFQIGCFYLKRGYVGEIKFGKLPNLT